MEFLRIVLILCIFSIVSSSIQAKTFHRPRNSTSNGTITRFRRGTITTKLTGVYTHEESPNVNCEITIRDLPENHPIFLNEQSNVLIPIGGKLRFNLNEKFEVNCVRSNFAKTIKAKTVVCTGKNVFSVELNEKRAVTSFNDINKCDEKVKLVAVKGNKCVGGGDLMHMRFLIDARGYFELYSSCYDDKSISTIYNSYILYGKALGTFIKLKIHLNDYIICIILDNLASIRHSSTFSVAINENNICAGHYGKSGYHRGHFMPYPDGIYPGWNVETNYYINAKPQKPKINGGAWSKLEKAIRDEAKLLQKNLQVFTGAFESSSFLDTASNKIEIHTFWYKIVLKDLREGMAFISCNDGSGLCNAKLTKYCDDICESSQWNILKNLQDEKVFCCELNDFYGKTNVPKIPETLGITKTLFSINKKRC